MPIEPPGPQYLLPDPSRAPAGAEFIAVGGDLSPGMLLAGYRRGMFAMPEGPVVSGAHLLGWWSPDPRGVLLPQEVHVGRSLRRALSRFEVTVDACFADVVDACADPRRPHGWISPAYVEGYMALHHLGWAHSIEVWDGSGLAGGLFGVEVGGLFAAESKFHHRTDASKVAVVALAEILATDGDSRRMIDVQWATEHLRSLGVTSMPRRRYLRRLRGCIGLPPAIDGHPRHSTRITWTST